MDAESLDPLSQLAIQHGTDKFGAHLYTPIYHELFSSLRDHPVRLLEIGVGGYGMPLAGGQSLRMWADYFQNGHIVGLDISPKRLRLPLRVCVVQGSQADTAFLQGLCSDHGPFDIIIDDGSHQVGDVAAAFYYLYPRMSSHGIYVVEDTQTAFWSHTGGNSAGKSTIFETAAKVALAMHASEIRADKAQPLATEYGDITSSVQIMRNLIVFKRGDNTFPSNADLSAEDTDVKKMFSVLDSEAVRNPSPGNYLTQIDLAAWAHSGDLQLRIVRNAVTAYPDNSDILLAALRILEQAGHSEECLALTGRLLSLFPSDPTVRDMMLRCLTGSASTD